MTTQTLTSAPTSAASTAAVPTRAVAGSAPGRKANIALWVTQGVLAAFFITASGIPKLIAHSSAVESFDKIGYGDWFMYVIGVLEILGGIALVIPRLAGPAALALIGLMTGAFIFTFAYFDGEYFASPVIFAALFIVVARGRRDSTREFLRALRSRA